MTRDELLAEIKREVCQVIEENRELEADDFDAVSTVIEEVTDNAVEASDEAADEDEG